MALASRSVTVTTAATRLDTLIDSGDNIAGQSMWVYNAGSAAVYLGGPTVTTATGVPVAATSWLPHRFDISQGDAVYGIVASASCDVRVLEIGV